MKKGYSDLSDGKIPKRTQKTFREWNKILDKFDIKEKGHTLAAKHLREKYNLSDWRSQVIAIKYEQMDNKKILICVDRDGTLIYDNKYYLGRTNNWRSKIKILKTVVKGLKKINKKLPEAKIYMITNQSGVAVKEFTLLTKKRAGEVCKAVIRRIKEKGARIDGYILCPHVSPKYAKESKLKFNKRFVCNCTCIKPSPGMVLEALKKEGFRKKDTNIYVIGDRKSDVETAHNISGTGILVPFKNESDEDMKLMRHKKNKSYRDKTYIAEDFLDASDFLFRREKQIC